MPIDLDADGGESLDAAGEAIPHLISSAPAEQREHLGSSRDRLS